MDIDIFIAGAVVLSVTALVVSLVSLYFMNDALKDLERAWCEFERERLATRLYEMRINHAIERCECVSKECGCPHTRERTVEK